MNRTIKIIAFLSALAIPTLAFTACGTVDEGMRGVLLDFGAVDGPQLSPGLHGMNPFTESIVEIDVKQRKFEKDTSASTKDQQMVHTTIAVNYRADPERVVEIYSDLGRHPESWEQTIFEPQIQEVLKSVTARYTALELITRRPEVKTEVTNELTKRITVSNFIVIEVSVTDFQFSPAYMAAVEAKQVAEQEAQRAQNELDRNALDVKKIEQQALAEKAAAIAKAEGEAEGLRIRAEAAAEYHRKIGEAATAQSLRHLEIEKWGGVTPLYVGEAGMLLPAK